MIEIQVAGAGAGKTYGLAKTILDKLNNEKPQKKLFALTYTNSARKKIESEILKQNYFFPDNLYIETVHNFFLNEIIFPFSGYILKETYHKASVIHLSSAPKFKAKKIKILKEQKIIHVEKVYLKARQIIDVNNSKNFTKKQKIKVLTIQNILKQCFDFIFIDEAQDLDLNALRVFEVLGSLGIFVHIVGDPKQAIRWASDFSLFIRNLDLKKIDHVDILPSNNISRRIPENILKYSNQFCYPGQEQVTLNKEIGSIKYIENTHQDYDLIIRKHINCSKSLVYIDQREGSYSTSHNLSSSFPESIELKIRDSKHNRDAGLVLKAAYADFLELAQINKGKAISKLINDYSLDLKKSEFAELYELGELSNRKGSKYIISSIDSIKGLEAESCIFVLTPNTFNYLTKGNIQKKQIFNKEWKKIYVALTRTTNRLLLVIDHDIFQKQNIERIKNELNKMRIESY